MKRFLIIIATIMFAISLFAQGYTKQQLESVLDSVQTNPDYVIGWSDRAIAKNVKCADAYFVKSFVFIAQKDYLQSLDLLNKSLRCVSKKSAIKKYEILCVRGWIYSEVEDYNLALADFTEAIKIAPKETMPYEYRINLYESLLQYDKAENDYRTLLSIKDSVDYKLELATVLVYQDKTEEALNMLDKIIKYQPNLVSPYALRAWINAVAGNSQAAINDYIIYMSLDGNYTLDHLVAYSWLDYTYTINQLSKLIVSDSDNGTWLSARIRVYIAHEQYELALTDLDALEIATEQSPFTLYQRSMCYRGLYEFNKQIESLSALIALLGDEEDADLYTMRAVAQRNAGNTDAAFIDFEKALQISPTSGYALSERGWTNDMLYKEKEAFKDYNVAITYSEPNAWLHIQRGRMYMNMEDSVKAKLDFELALQLDTASSLHAFALLYLGEIQQAIDFIKAIVSENINDAGEHYDLACIYSLANKKDEAIVALQQAIKLGYKAYNHIKLDRDLENIRDEQGYKDLLNDITKDKVSKIFEQFSY